MTQKQERMKKQSRKKKRRPRKIAPRPPNEEGKALKGHATEHGVAFGISTPPRPTRTLDVRLSANESQKRKAERKLRSKPIERRKDTDKKRRMPSSSPHTRRPAQLLKKGHSSRKASRVHARPISSIRRKRKTKAQRKKNMPPVSAAGTSTLSASTSTKINPSHLLYPANDSRQTSRAEKTSPSSNYFQSTPPSLIDNGHHMNSMQLQHSKVGASPSYRSTPPTSFRATPQSGLEGAVTLTETEQPPTRAQELTPQSRASLMVSFSRHCLPITHVPSILVPAFSVFIVLSIFDLLRLIFSLSLSYVQVVVVVVVRRLHSNLSMRR